MSFLQTLSARTKLLLAGVLFIDVIILIVVAAYFYEGWQARELVKAMKTPPVALQQSLTTLPIEPVNLPATDSELFDETCLGYQFKTRFPVLKKEVVLSQADVPVAEVSKNAAASDNKEAVLSKCHGMTLNLQEFTLAQSQEPLTWAQVSQEQLQLQLNPLEAWYAGGLNGLRGYSLIEATLNATPEQVDSLWWPGQRLQTAYLLRYKALLLGDNLDSNTPPTLLKLQGPHTEALQVGLPGQQEGALTLYLKPKVASVGEKSVTAFLERHALLGKPWQQEDVNLFVYSFKPL